MSQSYANHRRFDPAYHYVAFVLLLACISYAVAHIIHHRPGSWGELLLILLVRPWGLLGERELGRV